MMDPKELDHTLTAKKVYQFTTGANSKTIGKQNRLYEGVVKDVDVGDYELLNNKSVLIEKGQMYILERI